MSNDALIVAGVVVVGGFLWLNRDDGRGDRNGGGRDDNGRDNGRGGRRRDPAPAGSAWNASALYISATGSAPSSALPAGDIAATGSITGGSFETASGNAGISAAGEVLGTTFATAGGLSDLDTLGNFNGVGINATGTSNLATLVVSGSATVGGLLTASKSASFTGGVTLTNGALSVLSATNQIILGAATASQNTISSLATAAARTITIPDGLSNTNIVLSNDQAVTASSTTAAAMTGPSAVITSSASYTTAAVTAATALTVTAPFCTATSVVTVSICNYAGAYGTNGCPIVSVGTVAAGSFNINVYNAHATNALAGVLKFAVLIA